MVHSSSVLFPTFILFCVQVRGRRRHTHRHSLPNSFFPTFPLLFPLFFYGKKCTPDRVESECGGKRHKKQEFVILPPSYSIFSPCLGRPLSRSSSFVTRPEAFFRHPFFFFLASSLRTARESELTKGVSSRGAIGWGAPVKCVIGATSKSTQSSKDGKSAYEGVC